MTTLTEETLLTTEQVAELTNISRQTFEGWRYRKDGGPPFLRLGPQTVRYRWGTLRDWMQARTITPQSAA